MGVQPPADMPLLHCPCDDKGCHGFTILDLVYTRAKDSGFGEVSKLEYSDTLINTTTVLTWRQVFGYKHQFVLDR
jgi:hypothetical protein